jgi:signal transduction histidine kinase/CheY-like chemotaxis protein
LTQVDSATANVHSGDVLVVDDEPMVRDFVARVLTRSGFVCRTASDAGEAVAAATHQPPAVVITDIRMPGKDGGWLLGQLRQRWPEMPVIMLTADSEASRAVECLKSGAQDYLVKPIDVEELLMSVRRGTESAHRTHEARRQIRELEDDVSSRTERLRGALATIETAFHDSLGALTGTAAAAPAAFRGHTELPAWVRDRPRLQAARGDFEPDDALELASLRTAVTLITEGESHLQIARTVGAELLSEGIVSRARLWIGSGSDAAPEAAFDVGVGEDDRADPSLARRAISSGKSQSRTDGLVTSVAVPVVVRGVARSAIELGWNGPKDRRALTERIAAILAVSLSREDDLSERVRTAEELDIFQKLAGTSRYSLDLDYVAEFLLKSVHRVVDYDAAALLLIEDEPSLTVQTRCRMSEEFVERVRSHIASTLKLTCGLEMPQDIEARFVESEREERSTEPPAKLRSFVSVPLSVGGAVVGMIHVSSGRDQAFRDHEVQFVHRAAEFLASSMQGVRELLATVKGRVEQMVDHMSDGVLMLDARGRVVAMNGAARAALGSRLGDETPNAEALAKLLEWDPMSIMRSERRSMRRVVCLSGVPYQIQLSPVADESGELLGTVLAFRDFEEETKTDEMKTELVNVVSHELRTPLTAIRNALFLLQGPRLGPLSTEQNRFVDLAKRNVEQLIDIVNDLLDLSKIEAGKLHLDLTPMSVTESVAEVLTAFEAQLEEKGIVLESSLARDLPLVNGHAASIRRTVVNLVGNAVKYTEREGRVSVEVALAEGADFSASSGQAVRVSVTDSGVGIPADELESIFEKFHQVESGDPRTVPGTGLGLSICRELVKSHYGRIWAESETGRGSRFSFVIPVLSRAELLMRVLSDEVARARDLESPLAFVIARIVDVEAAEDADGDSSSATTTELLDVTRRVVRRSSDRVMCGDHPGEIAVILPRTPRDGGLVFMNRLLEEIARSTEANVDLNVAAVQYPDDARTPEELHRLAAEKIGETLAV